MRPVGDIERFIKNVPVNTSVQRDDEIRHEVLGALDKSQKANSIGLEPSLWRLIMRSQITKLVTAAVVIMAVLTGIHFLGGSIDGTNVVWGDVLEQISHFRPYSCTYTVENEGSPTYSYQLMRSSLSQRREIRSNGIILVFDLAIPKVLTLMPEKKRAIERTYNMKPHTDPDLLVLVRSMESGAFGKDDVQEIGVEKIEGHLAKGFRSLSAFNEITIWADVQTKLPVLIEIVHVGQGRKITMTEFEFDVEFDEALFSTSAPEGYTVEKVGKDEVTELTKFRRSTTEEDLVDGLHAVAVFLDSQFPHEIELGKLQAELREYIEQNNLSESEVMERLAPVSEKWTKAHWYITLLKGEMEVSDFHYAGNGVKLGEASKPIVWWLPKESETCRVIYGDLSVRDVTPEDLPK